MPTHSRTNMLRLPEADWPSLPRLEWDDWGKIEVNMQPHPSINHFHFPNEIRKLPNRHDQRLVGYADAVKQDVPRETLLRRIARVEGDAALPAELQLKIMKGVFEDWVYDSWVPMGGTEYLESLDDAISRLFRNCEDLTNLREVTACAARESVIYLNEGIDPDSWDAVAWLHRSFDDHPLQSEVRNFENRMVLSFELEPLTGHGLMTPSPPFDLSDPDIKQYTDPEQVQMLLAPTTSLRNVKFVVADWDEVTLLGSLKTLDLGSLDGRLHHFFKTLVAMANCDRRLAVTVEASVRCHTLHTMTIPRGGCATGLRNKLVETTTSICDDMGNKEE